MRTFVVTDLDKGKRLDVFLQEKLNITRSHVKNMVDKSLVIYKDQPFDRVGYKVRENDSFTVLDEPVEKLSLEPENVDFEIVYEDDDLAVINKPQGLVVHPCQTTKSGTLVNGLLLKLNNLSSINGVERPGIVHRLDKNTSGLLVVAKNDFSHVSLQKQISEKSAKRKYKAIVDGNVKEDDGEINQPIARSKSNRKIMAVDSSGRNAITRYKVIERFGKYTYMEFDLLTGRTHQIRAHAKFIHHPIIGDVEYGGSNEFNLNGQLLHAYKLSFNHPRTNERLTFNAELPSHFSVVLERLENKNKRNALH